MPAIECKDGYRLDDPCYPFCSKSDGSGCDYSSLGAGGSNPYGLTGDPYAVTYSDQGKVTGNFDTRVYVPTIDPYQAQRPPVNNFGGFAGTHREFMSFSDYTTPNCAFSQAIGTPESITQDGTTTELTAVPRFSTRDFFKDGEMDKLSPKPSGGEREAWKHAYKCDCGKWCVVEANMTMTTAEVKEECTQSGGGCEQKCPSSVYQNSRK